MKVILIKDVARLGRKGEAKEVPSGHAQNFLIPRKLAIPATPENMKRLAETDRKHSANKEESTKSFKEAVSLLAGKKVPYTTEANAQGHLFKGVSREDIAKAIQAEGFKIKAEDITLPVPIKSAGVHEILLERDGEKGVCTLEILKK